MMAQTVVGTSCGKVADLEDGSGALLTGRSRGARYSESSRKEKNLVKIVGKGPIE